ncbi:MAG: energy transducer TonB [Terricaulis sp.]
MADLVQVRSASLAASALMTGAALIAALTISYGVRLADPERRSPPTIIAEMVPLPKAAPRQLPPQAPTEDAVVVAPIPLQQEAVLSSDPVSIAPLTQPVLISDPHWLQRPRGLDRYYPVRAREAGIEGMVSLDCAVTTLGALHCVVTAETPPGWGFAGAALRMSGAYRMVPAMREGERVEGRYRMRIPFTLR